MRDSANETNKPDQVGLWHFKGFRYTGLKRQIRSLDTFVYVEEVQRLRTTKLVIRLFGDDRKFNPQEFVGEWVFLEKKVRRHLAKIAT
jgi:hypothetical protein